MKVWLTLFLGLSVAIAGGCSSMLANMAVSYPVPNYVYLHEQPAVGDFARYRSFDGLQIMQMEITAVSAIDRSVPVYQVKVHWPEASGWASGFLRQHAYLFEVGADGRVMRAALMHVPTGSVRPIQVAGPGQLGYIASPELVMLSQREALSAGNVDYAVDRLLVYEEHRQSAAGPSRFTSTNFINSELPFGLVKQVNVLQTEVTMVEVVKMINQFASTGTTVKRVMGFLLNRMKHQRAENGMMLIESGRGSAL